MHCFTCKFEGYVIDIGHLVTASGNPQSLVLGTLDFDRPSIRDHTRSMTLVKDI